MKYEALEGLKSNPLNTWSCGTRQKASVGYNKNHKGNAPWIIAEFTTCLSIQLLTKNMALHSMRLRVLWIVEFFTDKTNALAFGVVLLICFVLYDD
jgi:hypothetical protein